MTKHRHLSLGVVLDRHCDDVWNSDITRKKPRFCVTISRAAAANRSTVRKVRDLTFAVVDEDGEKDTNYFYKSTLSMTNQQPISRSNAEMTRQR